MRRVKSQNNKSTELRLIDIFKRSGIVGWRRNYPVKGRPDFVFPKKKIAVLWTAASGTGMTAGIRAPPTIRNTGKKNEKET